MEVAEPQRVVRPKQNVWWRVAMMTTKPTSSILARYVLRTVISLRQQQHSTLRSRIRKSGGYTRNSGLLAGSSDKHLRAMATLILEGPALGGHPDWSRSREEEYWSCNLNYCHFEKLRSMCL
jgi:hypothetical protein